MGVFLAGCSLGTMNKRDNKAPNPAGPPDTEATPPVEVSPTAFVPPATLPATPPSPTDDDGSAEVAVVASPKPAAAEVKIPVTLLDDRIQPDRITVHKGTKVTLTLKLYSTGTLAATFSMPDFQIKQALKPQVATDVSFTPTKVGAHDMILTYSGGGGEASFTGRVNIIE